MTKLAAVIFDLDGTIVDDEPLWEDAFLEVMKKHTIPISRLQNSGGWVHEPGVGLERNWRSILPERRSVEELVLDTRKVYSRLFMDSEGLGPRAGLGELLTAIKGKGLMTALATSSYWGVAEEVLDKLGLAQIFDVTTTGEEVTNLKPDPEIYLLTAQKLEVEPGECLVVEDAAAGVEAAAAAGCRVAVIKSDYLDRKRLGGAEGKYRIIDNYQQLVEELENL